MSQSLPLTRKRFNWRECRPFFAGVLPEESKRAIIARNLGISARNDFALLERIGGECAGAVTFLPQGTSLPAHEDAYRPLSEAELAAILRALPRRPLMAGEAGIRLSRRFQLPGDDPAAALIIWGQPIQPPGVSNPYDEKTLGAYARGRRDTACWLSQTLLGQKRGGDSRSDRLGRGGGCPRHAPATTA